MNINVLPEGMTLRDWLAMETMELFIKQGDKLDHYNNNEWILAEKCYRMADAMMVERGKKK